MSKKTLAPKTPSPIQRLRKTGRQADDLDHLDHAFEDHGTHRGKHRLPLTDVVGDLSVSTVLAAAMLYEALTPRDRRRIAMGKGLAMTVAVATADWIDPVADALYRANEWKDILKRSGSSRTTDRPETGNEACANALGSGRSVLGVSTAPERYLPSVLIVPGGPRRPALRRHAASDLSPGRHCLPA